MALRPGQAKGSVALGGGGHGDRNQCPVSPQILAYKDDFTSERADRERAQSRIQELEERVALLLQAARAQVGTGCFWGRPVIFHKCQSLSALSCDRCVGRGHAHVPSPSMGMGWPLWQRWLSSGPVLPRQEQRAALPTSVLAGRQEPSDVLCGVTGHRCPPRSLVQPLGSVHPQCGL